MNYPLIIAVSLLVLLVIAFLIKRNLKDKKEFEEEVIDAEIPSKRGEEKKV